MRGDIGQLEEFPPRVRLAQRGRDGALWPGGIIEPIIAGIGVGLQNAGEAGEVPPEMFLPAVTRGVIERGRRRSAAGRSVVADIGPDVPCDGLALGQDRHRGVVAKEPLGGQHMRLDEGMQRGKRRRAGADLISQRGDAQPSERLS